MSKCDTKTYKYKDKIQLFIQTYRENIKSQQLLEDMNYFVQSIHPLGVSTPLSSGCIFSFKSSRSWNYLLFNLFNRLLSGIVGVARFLESGFEWFNRRRRNCL